jgi:hypothetical protein
MSYVLQFDEDIGHLFLKCKYIKLSWFLLNMEKVRVDLLKQGTVQDMLTKIWGLHSDIKQKTILLMWC